MVNVFNVNITCDLLKTIKRDLELVRTRRTEQRRGRRRHGWALVSLVG